jgi:small multidrug resistance pump
LIFAMIKYNQIPNLYGIVGIILIITGVVMVNLLGRVD